jgi:cobalt/nickel transport system permease protein
VAELRVAVGAPSPSARPTWLLVAAIAATITTVSVSSLSALAALGVMVSLLLLRARPTPIWLLQRLASIAPIALLAGLLAATRVRGVDSARLWSLHPASEALHAGTFVAARIAIATLFAAWLSLVLSPGELERALTSLGVPPAVVELLALTRRFAGQLRSTLASAWISVALRGGFLARRRLGHTLGLVAGVVVVRALDRSQRVATALALRGHGYDAQRADAAEQSRALCALIALASVGVRCLT